MWCCLLFNFTQFVILENFSILDLALSGVKRLIPSFFSILLIYSAMVLNRRFCDADGLLVAFHDISNCEGIKWRSSHSTCKIKI